MFRVFVLVLVIVVVMSIEIMVMVVIMCTSVLYLIDMLESLLPQIDFPTLGEDSRSCPVASLETPALLAGINLHQHHAQRVGSCQEHHHQYQHNAQPEIE